MRKFLFNLRPARPHITGEQLDFPLDYEPHGHEGSEKPSLRRIDRVMATLGGETHVYQYYPERALEAVQRVKSHVEDGRLHPYAGLMIVKMIRESIDDD